MRISDWSSDVCSSDLRPGDRPAVEIEHPAGEQAALALAVMRDPAAHWQLRRTGNMEGTEDGIIRGIVRTAEIDRNDQQDRKSVVYGKSVSVRVDLGGRRNTKKKRK